MEFTAMPPPDDMGVHGADMMGHHPHGHHRHGGPHGHHDAGDIVAGYHDPRHHHHPHDMGMYHHNEGHMDAEFTEIRNVVVDGGDRFGVSCVAFDTEEELLWSGNSGGHISSYYSHNMQKYSSIQVHAINEVRQLLNMDTLILSLTRDNLRANSKYGRRLFDFNHPEMQDMLCMLQTGPTSLLMGGHQDHMLEIDVNTMEVRRKVETPNPSVAVMRFSSHYVCTGDTTGKVTLRDPNSLQSQHVLDAHSGALSDFDVHGNLLVTCGFTSRMGNVACDRFLMVYDLRVNRAIAPMQVPIEPFFLRFVPTYSNRICVVSQAGQFQLLEAGALSQGALLMYQVHTQGAPLSWFDISTSCQAMAFGDTAGSLHLFAGTPHPVYNTYSRPTEFPQLVPMNHPPMDINNELLSYGHIPLQFPPAGQPLLSDWPEEYCQKQYRKPLPIDSEIMRSVKMVQNIGYAPNPGNWHRNQVPYKLPTSSHKGHQRKSSVPESPIGRGEDPFVSVPKHYRKVEIKYSKLGVEDFDFRHYNKTNYAGLETHIPNAYCNSMLQMLYFLEPLRVTLKSHLCDKEFCLTCELGQLFHMFDIQKGKTCQASNFLRAFRTIPEASALGLILGDAEESLGKCNFPRLIQSFNRFILQQIHSETVERAVSPLSPALLTPPPIEMPPDAGQTPSVAGDERPPNLKLDATKGETESQGSPTKSAPQETVISKCFGMDVQQTFRCRCGETMTKQANQSLVNLVYPNCSQPGTQQKPTVRQTFSNVLKYSMCVEQTTQAWCNKCERYQPHVQVRDLKNLPNILALNCQLETERDLEFWKAQEEFVRTQYLEMNDPATQMMNMRTQNTRMCRYGNGCTRKDCKFRHENDEERIVQEIQKELIDHIPAYGWLPIGLAMKLGPDGQVDIREYHDEEELPNNPPDDYTYYELHGNVCHVKEPKTGGSLVTAMKVGETYHQRKEKVTCTQWYLFNDFAITPIERNEGTHFRLDWKVPCIVYFIRRKLKTWQDLTIVNPVTSSVLLDTTSMVTPRRRHVMFTPLADDELPKEGDLVGLDAEFVTLNQEEAELRSDGTRSTIKPSQMSVARITCIRGQGPLEGEPFVDDYISTQEQVVDYLTQFSGIKPGDLDANISSKHLTTLKSTYLKLRYLVDVGVVFVGHGLKKDFRVINIIVPKNQVIDTVEMFHMPRQRMISLKFLAWYFLGINIQSSTHDSTEDARTALKLYHKYQELTKESKDHFQEVLKQMYEKGRKLQWKIPDSAGGNGGDEMEMYNAGP